jgi:hypothetical protein
MYPNQGHMYMHQQKNGGNFNQDYQYQGYPRSNHAEPAYNQYGYQNSQDYYGKGGYQSQYQDKCSASTQGNTYENTSDLSSQFAD